MRKKKQTPGQKTEYKHIGCTHWGQEIEKHIKEKKEIKWIIWTKSH